MAKQQKSSVLNRLARKKLVFSGKFGYGIEDSLKALAEAQQGTVCDDLDDKVNYLVLSDLNAGKTIQKKAASLNAKGATIEVIDADGFTKLAQPTAEEILVLLRADESETYAKIHGTGYWHARVQAPKYTISSEDLSGIALQRIRLGEIHFVACDFAGAKFEHVGIGAATECDFSKATGDSIDFGNVPKCRFTKSNLNGAKFEGEFSDADFSGAVLEGAVFGGYVYFAQPKKALVTAANFAKAKLKSATFHPLQLKATDFSGADLTRATFQGCDLDSANFQNASLMGVVFVGCKLCSANFKGADLTGANFADADLTCAKLDGANLHKVNLRGAKLDGVDFSTAKNYDPSGTPAGSIGPALTELDAVNAKAQRIQVTFHVRSTGEEAGEAVGIDSSGLKWGWGVRPPQSIVPHRILKGARNLAFSDAMLQLADMAGHLQVAYETLDVSSTKSPKGGKELRELVMRGIAEAFAQEIPPAEELAAATKKYRDAEREKGAAAREEREKLKAQAAKEKAKAKKQIAKKIEKAVGKVNDVASFLKALELRIEKPKIDKATKMLKASGFKLFNDVTDEYVSGVVKSQTDPDLVYACRVAHDGQYACCTQNLNVCGGLRGSLCKHQLVLIIGLVQAGELDPTTIDGWIAKTHSAKPELDKETMGAIFLKYKGAEAGEVDWRPTETVPEDYYAL